MLARYHFKDHVRRQRLHSIGIDNKLVRFASRGRVIAVGPYFVGILRKIPKVDDAHIAQRPHTLFKSVLLVFVRDDANETCVCVRLDVAQWNGAGLGQKGSDMKKGTLGVVFLQKSQNQSP